MLRIFVPLRNDMFSYQDHHGVWICTIVPHELFVIIGKTKKAWELTFILGSCSFVEFSYIVCFGQKAFCGDVFLQKPGFSLQKVTFVRFNFETSGPHITDGFSQSYLVVINCFGNDKIFYVIMTFFTSTLFKKDTSFVHCSFESWCLTL